MLLLRISAVALLLALSVNAQQNESAVVRDIETDLPYDANQKLTTHVILYSGCKNDAALLAKPSYGFIARPVEGKAASLVFPESTSSKSECRAVCVERGVDKSHAYAVMPHKRYQSASKLPLSTFIDENCLKVEVCLMNYHKKDHPVQVYWLKGNGEKKHHMEIKYGERNTRCFSSFIGHEFEGVDGETNEVLGHIKVEYTTVLAFGTATQSDDAGKHNFDKEIERTLRNEWTRHNRVTRTFSPLGFKKGRLPDDIYASMTSFFVNNRGNAVLEEWQGKGVFVNWWETNCSFIQIPWALKKSWQIRLRELVEAWAGIPVEQTDMYGLRRYEAGARLLTHVDREATHAVSLIVNIAQGNLTEPWPVEVHDHADRLHEVIMKPGDIVYYESAKCLHGRNRPLAGEDAYYVNLFTHYRPKPTKDGKEGIWYTQPNHAGTPEAVVDVKGKCRLEPAGTTEAASGQLGVVETVHCDDERLGDAISPSLFQAASGDDLIDWWRFTGPDSKTAAIPKWGPGSKDEL